MGKIKRLARELVEAELNNTYQMLTKEHYFMFAISKFVLIKEKILKKDSQNNILHFDSDKNKGIIPEIQKIANEIKKHGTYVRHSTLIDVTGFLANDENFKDDLWIYNKMRDSFMHGHYEIDADNNEIIIDNDHMQDKDPFLLKCKLPVSLINIDFGDIKQNKSTYFRKVMVDSFKNELQNKEISKESEIDDVLKYKGAIDKYETLPHKERIEKKNLYEENLEEANRLAMLILDSDDLDNLYNKLSWQQIYLGTKKIMEWIPYEKGRKLDVYEGLCLFVKNYEEDKKFEGKSIEILDDLKKLIGNEQNRLVPILYNYMALVFSDENQIDYSHICTRDIDYNYSVNNETNQAYSDIVGSLKTKCNHFINKIGLQISAYTTNPNEHFKNILKDIYPKFYMDIMQTLAHKNKLILDCIRNAIAHGNYIGLKSDIVFYDMANHTNLDNIKFAGKASPRALIEITKHVELNDAKDIFTMLDFFKELEKVLDVNLVSKLYHVMNKFSKIVFDEEIDLTNSMESMYIRKITSTLRNI